MEEEYDFQSMRKEAIELHRALTVFMDDKSVDKLDLGTYRYQIIRGVTRKWNVDKLKAAVGKGKLLRVCKLVVDPDKIDDMVRQGKLDLKEIEGALEEEPKAPYIKRYENKEATGKKEADALKEAMGG